jgi:hypothetical protein
MSTEDPYGLLVVDHGKLTPIQGDPDPLDNEPIEASDQHNQLGDTWFGIRWNLGPVQEVATEDHPRRSTRQAHEQYTGAVPTQWWRERSAGEVYMKWSPRYRQTFLDYDRPFDPYPIHSWDANRISRCWMKKQRKRTASPCWKAKSSYRSLAVFVSTYSPLAPYPHQQDG